MKRYAVLVEDDIFMIDTLTEFLRRQGYDPMSFVNAEAALEFLQDFQPSADEQIEVLITDFSLPRYSGLDILRRVRACNLQIPVIVISAGMTSIQTQQALKEGAAAILSKPFTLAVLAETIQSSRSA